ncbi:MAG: HAD family hydrolase [Acidimicrobiales bacterium]|nr:HAD family hydrolase [Acidimicrobiales bacterium]
MVVYAFDVGETLVDESRLWLRYAHQIGVPPLTFIGVLGAAIAEGRDQRDVFQHFDVDLDRFEANLAWRNRPEDVILPDDFYPDVIPTLETLQRVGHRVVVAGNQNKRTSHALDAMNLPVDLIRGAEQWGARKPTRRFFRRLIREAAVPPGDIVYVGDRVDHDILPALDLGIRAVLIRRGPWGHVHASWPDAARADAVIGSLRALL